jgi:hypothetical protein
MATAPELPIEVGPSAVPDTAKAAGRYLVATAVAFAVGKGWVDAENAEGIVTAGVGLIAIGWGLYATFRRKSQLVVTADAAPNSVAVVK